LLWWIRLRSAVMSLCAGNFAWVVFARQVQRLNQRRLPSAMLQTLRKRAGDSLTGDHRGFLLRARWPPGCSRPGGRSTCCSMRAPYRFRPPWPCERNWSAGAPDRGVHFPGCGCGISPTCGTRAARCRCWLLRAGTGWCRCPAIPAGIHATPAGPPAPSWPLSQRRGLIFLKSWRAAARVCASNPRSCQLQAAAGPQAVVVLGRCNLLGKPASLGGDSATRRAEGEELDRSGESEAVVCEMKRWPQSTIGQPPGSWLLRLGAVALVCLALVISSTAAGGRGKGPVQDRVDYTLTRSERQLISVPGPGFSSFAGARRRANFAGGRPWRFRSSPRPVFCGPISVGPIFSDALMAGRLSMRWPIFSGALPARRDWAGSELQ